MTEELDLGALVSELNESLKGDSIRTGADYITSDITGRVPTGITPLDAVLGGGYPLGRYVVINGWEGHGKSTMIEAAFKSVQDMSGIGVLIDADSGFDKNRASHLGVDVGRLLIIEEETVEKILEAIMSIILKAREKMPDTPIIIAWDSVTASPTNTEYVSARDTSKSKWAGGMSEKPRILRSGFRKITKTLAGSRAGMILASHLIHTFDQYKPYDMPGGTGIRFWSSCTMNIRRGAKLMLGEKQIGFLAYIMIQKSRLCAPYQVIVVPLFYDTGFDDDEAIFAALQGQTKDEGMPFYRSGSWQHFLYEGKNHSFYAKDLKATLDKLEGSREFLKQECWRVLAPEGL